MTICQAIAREEGYGIAGGRSTRNFNPGDINYGAFSIAHGAVGVEEVPAGHNFLPRFAKFPDEATGFAAMKALLSVPGTFQTLPDGSRRLISGYGGSTLSECLYRWAPPADDNDTSAYLSNVCSWTSLTADTVIDEYL